VVLLIYVATHLLNHALGLISLGAMEWGRNYFLAVWRNPVGTLALYGALSVHLGLVLYALFRRRSLRMPMGEALQYIAGFAIPPLLALHVIGNRGLYELYDLNDLYAWVLIAIWISDPMEGIRLVAALLLAWFHGCAGLHCWLKLKPWYAAGWAPSLFTVALLWPAFSLAGVAAGLREVAILLEQPAWAEAVAAEINYPSAEGLAWALGTVRASYWGMAAILVAVVVARLARHVLARRAKCRYR
jgi:adenylate cyclase